MIRIVKTSRYIIFVSIILIPALLYAFGGISHIGAAEDVLDKAKRGELPQDIASAILAYPEYFKAGSIAPDLFYMSLKHDFSKKMHDNNTEKFYKTLLRKASTPQEKAFAYGAVLHMGGDVKGHPYINIKAGGVYGESLSATSLHLLIPKLSDSLS